MTTLILTASAMRAPSILTPGIDAALRVALSYDPTGARGKTILAWRRGAGRTLSAAMAGEGAGYLAQGWGEYHRETKGGGPLLSVRDVPVTERGAYAVISTGAHGGYRGRYGTPARVRCQRIIPYCPAVTTIPGHC